MPDNVVALDGDVIIEHSLALREAGWTLLPSIVPAERVARLIQALDEVYAQQRPIQMRNGVGEIAIHPLTLPMGVNRITGLLIPASRVASITSSMSL